VESFKGLFVSKVVCLFCFVWTILSKKLCGLWHHLCDVNWIVSSITIYNMWRLMWHIVLKNCNLTLINGTYRVIKKSFSWLFFCVIKESLSLLIALCDSFMDTYQFFEFFWKKWNQGFLLLWKFSINWKNQSFCVILKWKFFNFLSFLKTWH